MVDHQTLCFISTDLGGVENQQHATLVNRAFELLDLAVGHRDTDQAGCPGTERASGQYHAGQRRTADNESAGNHRRENAGGQPGRTTDGGTLFERRLYVGPVDKIGFRQIVQRHLIIGDEADVFFVHAIQLELGYDAGCQVGVRDQKVQLAHLSTFGLCVHWIRSKGCATGDCLRHRAATLG